MSSSFKDTDLEVAFFRLATPQTVDFGVCVCHMLTCEEHNRDYQKD